jgi:hypothetical protein
MGEKTMSDEKRTAGPPTAAPAGAPLGVSVGVPPEVGAPAVPEESLTATVTLTDLFKLMDPETTTPEKLGDAAAFLRIFTALAGKVQGYIRGLILRFGGRLPRLEDFLDVLARAERLEDETVLALCRLQHTTPQVQIRIVAIVRKFGLHLNVGRRFIQRHMYAGDNGLFAACASAVGAMAGPENNQRMALLWLLDALYDARQTFHGQPAYNARREAVLKAIADLLEHWVEELSDDLNERLELALVPAYACDHPDERMAAELAFRTWETKRQIDTLSTAPPSAATAAQ